jgi:uncharacterized membrane protein YoaK (UPF0700 family)
VAVRPESHSTQDTPREVLFPLALLTLVTGSVDAASVLDLGHVFTANMTGNVVFLGFALAGKGNSSVVASLVALGGFLAGALFGGKVTHDVSLRSLRVAFGAEVVLFAGATVCCGLPHAAATLPVVVLLAAAMGLRNAVVRRLAVPDMTTTVLTLTVTGLAADSGLAGGSSPRFGRRVGSIIVMLAGAALGALLMRAGVVWV